MTVYRCSGCGDLVLIVLTDDEVDPDELAAKAVKHAKQHDDLEAMLAD